MEANRVKGSIIPEYYYLEKRNHIRRFTSFLYTKIGSFFSLPFGGYYRVFNAPFHYYDQSVESLVGFLLIPFFLYSYFDFFSFFLLLFFVLLCHLCCHPKNLLSK